MTARPVLTRLRDLYDMPPLGAGDTGKVVAYDNATQRFVMTDVGTQLELDAAVAGLVTLTPGASTRNVVQPTGDFNALRLRRNAAGSTAKPLVIEDELGVELASVSPAGVANFGQGVLAGTRSSVSNVGIISSAQFTVAWPADRIGVIVRAAVSQAANLQEWQDSTPTVLASVLPTGRISATTFSGRPNTAGTALIFGSVTGDTSSRINIDNQGILTWGPGNLASDLKMQRILAGSTSRLSVEGVVLTTNGTLTSGSAVVTGIATTASMAAGMAITGTGVTPGATILSVDSPTQITMTGNASASGVQSLTVGYTPQVAVKNPIAGSSSAAYYALDSTGLARFQVSSLGDVTIGLDTTGANYSQRAQAGWGDVLKVYRSGTNVWTLQDANVGALMTNQVAANVAWRVRGAAAQSADLQRWENSAGVSVVTVTASGTLQWGGGTNPVDVGLTRVSAGFMQFQAVLTNYTGTLTNGSAVVTGIASTTGIVAGMVVSGTGVPTGATVLTVDSATQITMSAVATAGGAQTLSIGASGTFGFRASSTQQAAAIFQVQDSAGTNALIINQFRNTTANGGLQVQGAMGTPPFAGSLLVTPTASQVGQIIKQAASPSVDAFRLTDSLDNPTFLINKNGQLLVNQANAGNGITTGQGGASSASLGLKKTLFVDTGDDASVGVVVARRASTQTADLQSWRNESNVGLSRIDKNGYFITAKTAAPADADLGNGELAVWLDATVAATRVMFKAKDSAGTVRTASLAMA